MAVHSSVLKELIERKRAWRENPPPIVPVEEFDLFTPADEAAASAIDRIETNAVALAEDKPYEPLTTVEIIPPGDTLVDRARQLNADIGNSYIELGKVCKTMIAQGVPDQLGYEDIGEFFEKEIGLHYRKARYLTAIATFIEEHQLSEHEVGQLGWSKAKELVGAPAEKVTELLELAPKVSTEELKERIREAKNVNSDATLKAKKTLNLKFFDDQMIVVDSGLDLACKVYETDNKALAFFKMVSDWTMNQPVAPDLTALVAYLESTYNAKVILPEVTNG